MLLRALIRSDKSITRLWLRRTLRACRETTKAREVIDTYDTSKPMEGRIKEQAAIDAEGGVPNLDNKRNEIRKKK